MTYFGMDQAKPVSVPADPHTMLCSKDDNDNTLNNPIPYREAILNIIIVHSYSVETLYFLRRRPRKSFSK